MGEVEREELLEFSPRLVGSLGTLSPEVDL
jgi:hypothetical protein